MTTFDNADNKEIDKFDRVSQIWWDLKGEMGTLHTINPLRTKFIMERLATPNPKILDVGCGGGILSEALAKELPVLVYKPLHGQEYHNAIFLSKTGAGIIIKNKGELKNILKHILVDNACLKKMKEAARAIKRPEAAMDIAHSLIENISMP